MVGYTCLNVSSGFCLSVWLCNCVDNTLSMFACLSLSASSVYLPMNLPYLSAGVSLFPVCLCVFPACLLIYVRPCRLSVWLLPVCQSVSRCLYENMYILLLACQCVFFYLSVRVCFSNGLSVCVFVCLCVSFYLSAIVCLSTCLSVYVLLLVCQGVSFSVCFQCVSFY